MNVEIYNYIRLKFREAMLSGADYLDAIEQRKQLSGIDRIVTTNSKLCSSCLKEKRLEDFHRDPSAFTGRHSQCAKCRNGRKQLKYDLLAEAKRRT